MLYMSLWQLLQAHFLTIYSYNKFREEVCQFECRISIPQLQVRGALSGGEGGCLCQWELKAPTDRSQSDCVHEQAAKADCECPLYKCAAYIKSDYG